MPPRPVDGGEELFTGEGFVEEGLGAPQPNDLTERLTPVWLDHLPGWTGSYLHPSDNMPDYGRDLADLVGQAALTLQLDLPDEQKRPLAIAMVQLGLDVAGVVQNGGRYVADGGSGAGEIQTTDGTNISMTTMRHRVMLQRRGNRLVEIARFGFETALGTFSQDVNANGYAVTNLSRKVRYATGSTVSPTLSDRDWVVRVQEAANVALPTDKTGDRKSVV